MNKIRGTVKIKGNELKGKVSAVALFDSSK